LIESDWDKYSAVPTTEGVDFIIDNILVENPDFSDLGALTEPIENVVLKFIEDVESFLSQTNDDFLSSLIYSASQV